MANAWVAVKQLAEDRKDYFSTQAQCELSGHGACVNVAGIPIDDVAIINGIAVWDPTKKAVRDATDATTQSNNIADSASKSAAMDRLKKFDPKNINDVKELANAVLDIKAALIGGS